MNLPFKSNKGSVHKGTNGNKMFSRDVTATMLEGNFKVPTLNEANNYMENNLDIYTGFKPQI